ncbi:MAG TPA: tRNA (adenosine(37)-N6)-dimethylallyltransferase MiaA [Ignavibacteria bacterium]
MKKVLAIVGPTASGKTEIALSIVAKLNAEIISADSRQIYKYIPIATAVPSKQDLSAVKHYFIEELELEVEFNSGEYGKAGGEIIFDIFLRHKIPIVVGGSGLYLKSLIEGFFEGKTEEKEIREKLEQRMKNEGKESLYSELMSVDSESALKMDATKFRRVIRALEVYYVTGKKMSDIQKEKINVGFETIQIGLNLPRDYLYERINNRVDKMIEIGLIDEIKLLKDKGYHYKTHSSLNTVGIKEVFRYLEGELTKDKMTILIKQNSRQYAKRQMTWFRKDKNINWILVERNTSVNDTAKKIVSVYLKKQI